MTTSTFAKITRGGTAFVLACSMSLPTQALADEASQAANQQAQASQTATEGQQTQGSPQQTSETQQSGSSESAPSQQDEQIATQTPASSESLESSSIQDGDHVTTQDAESADRAPSAESSSSDTDAQLDATYYVDWTENGTCEWSISKDGELVVRPANGASTGTLKDSQPWSTYKNNIRSVRFEKTVKATDCASMFSCCYYLTTIDLRGLDTSQATSMANMFVSDLLLTSVDMSSLNTANVTSMMQMFDDCQALLSANLSSLNTAKVTDMRNMFNNCQSLTSLNLSSFNTAKVTNMENMFYNCKSLKSLNLSSFNTAKVSSMASMFRGCSSLAFLDVASFDGSQLTTAGSMFTGCESLTSVNLANFKTPKLENAGNFFNGCSKLESVDLSRFDTSKTTFMLDFFGNCTSLKTIKLGADFDFRGLSTSRQCSFCKPSEYTTQKWKSSADGKTYSYDQIPNCVASTYTRQNVHRLFGNSRYETSYAISQEGFDSASCAIVASGENFPDALGASALAGAVDGPVVLTSPSNWNRYQSDYNMTSELKRLGVKKVYIIGGSAAVPTIAETKLKAAGYEVERVYGDTRQQTAARVAEKVASLSSCDTAIVASGTTPWDSLSASPYAYAKKCPIYLTEGDGSLSANTISAIRANRGIKKIVIVGGDSAVWSGAEASLRSAGYSVERWSGNTRYDTSQIIASKAIAQGMSASTVAVASGENFPDALAGGALAGSRNGVLLLSPKSDGEAAASWIASHRTSPADYYLLGGTGALSDNVSGAIQGRIW